MFSKEIEIVITLLQNVSNNEVSSGDVDGTTTTTPSPTSSPRTPWPPLHLTTQPQLSQPPKLPSTSPPLTPLLLTFCSKVITISIFLENVLYFVLAISGSNFAQILWSWTFFNSQDEGLFKNVHIFKNWVKFDQVMLWKLWLIFFYSPFSNVEM